VQLVLDDQVGRAQVATPLGGRGRVAQHNVAAGEDIRYLDRDRAEDLPGHDYWLFDSSRLYRLHFDEDDDLRNS